MKNYPVILLVGDIEFPPSFVHELTTAVKAGSRILLHPRHVEALGPDAFKKLSEAGTIEVLDPGVNSETKRPAAISNERLHRIADEYLPIGVVGDPVEYQINRNDSGWVIELINNDGVVKDGRKPAVTYPSVIAHVKLSPRFEFKAAREWLTKTELKPDNEVEVEISPGDTRFVQFDTRD